jgi:hypothetical protein
LALLQRIPVEYNFKDTCWRTLETDSFYRTDEKDTCQEEMKGYLLEKRNWMSSREQVKL